MRIGHGYDVHRLTEGRKLTPQQMAVGVMGISLEQLINEILENRDGRFDCLFKNNKEESQ